jgi:uncharacterized protein YeaO (DUF488 family)
MAIRIVQLGSPRHSREGIRIGTVRRPPRGVRKTRYAAEDYFDVWLPNLAPSAELISAYRQTGDDKGWKRFTSGYKSEMARPENSRVLDVLAALSRTTNFSVGCYCEDERRCHRSILRDILKQHGARIVA